MFKYTPRKDILARLAKANKRPYPAYYNVLSEVAGNFSHGDKHDRYNIYIAFSKDYQRMSAFYSPKRVRFVPCGSVLIPVGAFTEEEVNA